MTYYKRDGTPCDTEEWMRLLSDPEYKILKQEILPNGKKVSTVWLGLDHQFGSGEPLIFETMVFPSSGNYHDEQCKRYSTEAEALAGHERIVKELTK